MLNLSERNKMSEKLYSLKQENRYSTAEDFCEMYTPGLLKSGEKCVHNYGEFIDIDDIMELVFQQSQDVAYYSRDDFDLGKGAKDHLKQAIVDSLVYSLGECKSYSLAESEKGAK